MKIEGGGGSDASATAIIKDGVITKIDVISPGFGYQEGIFCGFLDDGEEHPESSRAQLRPVVVNGRIDSIEIIDGGKNYFPSHNNVVVQLDYNSTVGGYGFKAGPIHTEMGILDKIIINNHGSGFSQPPYISIDGGGQVYSEGEPVHLRVVSNVAKGVSELRLIANGVYQENRPYGQPQLNPRDMTERYDREYVEVVKNDPYYDLFWVPDRNLTKLGVDGVSGVGNWSLSVEMIDASGERQVSQPIQIMVIPSKVPTVTLLTPENNSTFVYDRDNTISFVADADDEDGIVREGTVFGE